jgi:phage repressor protein C with HTH and peptisase S24 domain
MREKVELTEAINKKLWQVVKDLINDNTKVGQLSEMLAANKLEAQEPGQTISAGRLVPIINKVSAGYPTDFDDLDYPVGVADDYVRCPDLHDANAFAVRVVGDSMEPKFKEGDIVVFSPALDVKNGDDCFVRFAEPHQTAFKRVFFEENKMIRLQPRNEKYAPTMVEGKKINGIYKAIAKVEKL